jgi:predicted nucleic acid-binding protein
MRIAVKDANVFIDLESMGILDLWFQLGHETLTSSYVVVELEDGGHANALACIRAGQVREAEISPEEMIGDFEKLWRELEGSGLSVPDASVLFLAIREKAILLSGDKQLRKQAKLRTVQVRGTLWIMDQLVEEGILQPGVAADRLGALMCRTGKERRYLPAGECEARILKWRRS